MIGRVLLAAILAGIAAGLLMGGIQHVRLTPMIIVAESFEGAAPAHDHGTAAAASAADHQHEQDAEGWMPADGFERTFYTTVTAMLTGAAFALMLAGISLLAGIPITAANGAIWGLCGFLAATLAPAAGLPPELPGVPAADLGARQIWWVSTIVATGLALLIVAKSKQLMTLAAAAILIALPHLIGAPAPVTHETAVPAGLAASFAANTIAAGAVFWVLIGTLLGLAMSIMTRDTQAAS